MVQKFAWLQWSESTLIQARSEYFILPQISDIAPLPYTAQDNVCIINFSRRYFQNSC